MFILFRIIRDDFCIQYEMSGMKKNGRVHDAHYARRCIAS